MSNEMRGLLVLIVGPSGSGKGTVISRLKERHPDWVYPVSYTTRKIRPSEVDGKVYHFISREEFEKGIAEGEFLEHAIVHSNNYYGTAKREIMEALVDGKVVVRELDIQGFKLVREIVPAKNLASIFLMVNSLEDLKARILHRGKLPDEEIERRMESARLEIAQKDLCDHVVPSVTGEIEACTDRVDEIVLQQYRSFS